MQWLPYCGPVWAHPVGVLRVGLPCPQSPIVYPQLPTVGSHGHVCMNTEDSTSRIQVRKATSKWLCFTFIMLY